MINIGISQNFNSYNWERNYQKAISTINYFSRRNVDLVCFQEAFLSGYSAESLMLDYDSINFYLQKIKVHAYEMDVCVLLPTLNVLNEKCYNVVYVFNSDDGDKVIYKNGLTLSEKVMMYGKRSNRVFSINGHKMGVLICREMEDKAFDHLNKGKLPDLILWPSYWGWKYHDSWCAIKRIDGKRNRCYSLVNKLKRPLIQINMASTPDGAGKIIKGGKSVIVNSENIKVGTGKYGTEDKIIIKYDGNKLQKI